MKRKTTQTAARDEQLIQTFAAKGPHLVSTVVFPGASAYDMAAAAEVFSTANGQLRRERGLTHDVYRFEVIATSPGPVEMELGLKVMPDRTTNDPIHKMGTLILSGGCAGPIDAAVEDKDLVSWVKRAAPKAERVASMCTGAFLLAEAGLVKKAVTTHWAQCDRLSQRFPNLDVYCDSIYVKEDNVYSSAGSTAAMDLALTLVEEDLGRKLAMNVARRLVMFLKRPGGQSQFSTALLAQTASTDALRDLPEWIADNLDEDLSVEALAERAGMSARNFARVFTAETKLTPAKYVERTRLERARQLIEETALPLMTVAAKAGFESDQQLRRTFVRWLGVTPAEYLERFRDRAPSFSMPAIGKSMMRNGPEEQPWLP